ncbi:hypothetical protein LPJ53_001817 [Coemansia erecta]|uniref:RTA1 like protein n=1 Tax=Coemansia erecta TaxID=147472 RepID=A0A9W7Y376_9FUNG|nr:hypothetical protein LPJ53_001817 [Coemansia erecta]
MSTTLDYFAYIPVHGAPETAAVLFAVLAVISTLQILNTNSARWQFILVGTAAAESIGYIFRSVCINHISLGLFICMNLFLLLPPNALALFNYKIIGEVARGSGVEAARFWKRPHFLVWFFFASDVFSFVLQSTGASMTAAEDAKTAGKWICIVGLAIQLVFLGLFLLITVAIMRDRRYTVLARDGDATGVASRRRVFRLVIATSVLIYVRSIYRLIEFIDGYGGRIYRAEWAFYVFDFAMIFLAVGVYVVWHIGHHFPRKSKAIGGGDAAS